MLVNVVSTRTLADRLSECVQQEASVFLFAPGWKLPRPSKRSFLCSCCGSSIGTHSDPNGNLLRRHQVGPKRPSSSDTRNQDGFEPSSRESWTSHQWRFDEVLRCRSHSRGTKKAVKCMRSSTCDKDECTSQPQAISYSDRRRTLPSSRDSLWICVMWWTCA